MIDLAEEMRLAWRAREEIKVYSTSLENCDLISFTPTFFSTPCMKKHEMILHARVNELILVTFLLFAFSMLSTITVFFFLSLPYFSEYHDCISIR